MPYFHASRQWIELSATSTPCPPKALVQSTSQPAVVLLGAGILFGLFKGRIFLSRTATRSAARIARRGDGKCLGGFLSWQSWLFVLARMGMGAALRHSALPRWVLGVVYTAVGVALLWGSRVFWVAWRRAA